MSINNTYELLLSCLTGITSNQLAAINNEYEAFEAVYSTSVPGLNINVSNLADSFVPTTTTGLSYLDSVNSISTLASVIALPIAGVRYIASSTSTVSGVTWTINKIYTTNASLSYTEYTPVVGDAVIVSSLFKIYRWSGAAWVVEPTILTYSSSQELFFDLSFRIEIIELEYDLDEYPEPPDHRQCCMNKTR